MLAVAALLAIVALTCLAGAGVAGLILSGLPPWAAALIVGLALAAFAVVVASRGIAALRPARLAPVRSLQNLRRDVETLKEMVSHDRHADTLPERTPSDRS
jgi:hypothetical protein